MKRLGSVKDSSGFTLIELLVSIVLLSIVITYFLVFFSQSITLSTKVEDKLTAVNVAEKVLNTIRKEGEDFYDRHPDKLPKVNGKVYYPEIISPSFTTKEEADLRLKRVQVNICIDRRCSSDSIPDSELYSYIEVRSIIQ